MPMSRSPSTPIPTSSPSSTARRGSVSTRCSGSARDRVVSGFRVRREVLADDAPVVVRGGVLVDASVRRDARIAFLRFGEYGISALAVPDEASFRRVAAGALSGSARLTLMTAGAIRRARLACRRAWRPRRGSGPRAGRRPGRAHTCSPSGCSKMLRTSVATIDCDARGPWSSGCAWHGSGSLPAGTDQDRLDRPLAAYAQPPTEEVVAASAGAPGSFG